MKKTKSVNKKTEMVTSPAMPLRRFRPPYGKLHMGCLALMVLLMLFCLIYAILQKKKDYSMLIDPNDPRPLQLLK